MVKARIQQYSKFKKEVTYGGSSLIYQLAKDSGLGNVGVDYVEIKPNTELKEHYHNYPNVLILILEGEGIAYLNNKEYNVKKGDVINIPQKTSHGFKTGKEKLVFLSIQTPPIYGKDVEKDTYFLDK